MSGNDTEWSFLQIAQCAASCNISFIFFSQCLPLCEWLSQQFSIRWLLKHDQIILTLDYSLCSLSNVLWNNKLGTEHIQRIPIINYNTYLICPSKQHTWDFLLNAYFYLVSYGEENEILKLLSSKMHIDRQIQFNEPLAWYLSEVTCTIPVANCPILSPSPKL